MYWDPAERSGQVSHAHAAAAPGQGASRRIVVLSSHVYLCETRKASVHFVAENWARMGHEVNFTTVGYSWINLFRRSERFHALRREQNNRYRRYGDNLEAGGYLPLMHGFSSASRPLDWVGGRLLASYAGHLPDFIAERVGRADLVVFESGTPVAFVETVRRLNPSARLLYFCRDLLSTVGASRMLQEIERRVIGLFDVVCVPSRRLGEGLPPGGRVVYVPQGIDEEVFARAAESPYAPGTLNAIAAGDMLFDRAAVTAMAEAAPEVTFHLFGISWTGRPPANVRLHGERPFSVLAPHIRHADFGIAPYRYSAREAYLAESSLKLLQYAYCGLPVVVPEALPVSRGNELRYRPGGANDWGDIVRRAVAMRREGVMIEERIASWQDVARQVLETVDASQPAAG